MCFRRWRWKSIHWCFSRWPIEMWLPWWRGFGNRMSTPNQMSYFIVFYARSIGWQVYCRVTNTLNRYKGKWECLVFFSTVTFGCFYHMVTILKKYTLFQILVSLKTFAAGYLSPAILMQHQLPEKVETGAKVIDVTQVCFYHRTWTVSSWSDNYWE